MYTESTYWQKVEEENNKRGLIGSACFHTILLLIFLLPWFSSTYPPPGPQGVLVNFGNPIQESTEEAAGPKYVKEEISEPTKAEEAKPQEVKKQAEEPKKAPQKEPAKAVPAKYIKTVKETETESPVALKEEKEKKQKEQELLEEQKRKKAEADAKAEQERIEAEAVAKAEAEAKQKAAAEAKAKKEAEAKRLAEEKRKQEEAYAKTKSELSGLFDGNGTNLDAKGEKGDPSGKGKSEILEGLSKGTGKVGGGLSGRGIIFEPVIKENSQKQGKVVVKVCVDKSGKVISAKYTQRGSTTTDTHLVGVAEKNAGKYQFTPGELDEQCGTITIDFLLK